MTDRLKIVFFFHSVCVKINKGPEHLADFTIERTVYQLGDVVRGYIDFSKATVRSFFLSMKLEVIEEVASEYFANHPGRPSATHSNTIAEAEEVLHDVNASNFEFHLPLTSPPTFATEFVSIRWVLKFELVASKLQKPSLRDLEDAANNPEKPSHSSPNDLAPQPATVERMTWQMPIRVLVASYPVNLLDQTSKASKTWVC